MALSRLFGGWIAVVAWLLLWELVASRLAVVRGEGKIGRALWFGSLGAGGWWLVFGLVGALREWPGSRGRRTTERPDPVSIGASLLRIARTMVAGGLLAWRLAPT